MLATAEPARSAGMQSNGRGGASPPPDPDDYEEISLVDIVRTLHKRRAILAVTFVLALVAGGAFTVFTTPQYEAQAKVIPLDHTEIVQSWLGSRQAAELASDSVGNRLYPVLFPDEWDESTESWRTGEPSRADIGLALQKHVEVNAEAGNNNRNGQQILTVGVTLPDAVLARDVAQAYMGTLTHLRPHLENLTRAELFDNYYDGTNEQEARAQAETAAREKTYWLVFDSPTTPEDPVKPKPVLNMALAAVLGLMLGVFAAFTAEWFSNFKTEFQRVEPPPR